MLCFVCYVGVCVCIWVILWLCFPPLCFSPLSLFLFCKSSSHVFPCRFCCTFFLGIKNWLADLEALRKKKNTKTTLTHYCSFKIFSSLSLSLCIRIYKISNLNLIIENNLFGVRGCGKKKKRKANKKKKIKIKKSMR